MASVIEFTYAQAVVAALREALESDERVHLIGGYFLGVTTFGSLLEPLQEDFADRVTYPPIAELGTVGTAIGAAIGGLRPIVDIGTASFIFQAFAQIVNEAANVHYMSGGQARVPMIFTSLALPGVSIAPANWGTEGSETSTT